MRGKPFRCAVRLVNCLAFEATGTNEVDELLQTVEIETGEAPAAAVIWLHGLGADGNDFVPIVPELRIAATRFVFPHAPVRPVTLNNGIPMRAWFDLTTLDHAHADALDRRGLGQSIEAVGRLIAREGERGIDPSRIVIAGFSQGGALALAAALGHSRKLAGIIGLSTWAPFAAPPQEATNHSTPVFLAHGQFDPVVAPALGVETRDKLREAGMEVEWHTYPMPHAVCAEEIEAIGAFLRRVLE